MLEFCGNDDILALVLGHELGHLIQPVHFCFDRLLSTSICLFSIHIYDFKGHVLDQIICKLIFASCFLNPLFLKGLLWDLHFSRKKEIEADEIGLKLSTKAHFNVEEGSLYLDKMEQIQLKQLKEKKLKRFPEFLSTHPNDKKRFVHLTTSIQKMLLVEIVHEQQQSSYEVEYHREFWSQEASYGSIA